MLKLIEGLTLDVFVSAAVGKITRGDYRKVLIPAAQAMMTEEPV